MWSLELSKESFKFSGAHFTTFSKNFAERLHGHNYYVSISLCNSKNLNHGMILDLNIPKKQIQDLLSSLDEKVLIAQHNPYTKIIKTCHNYEIHFGQKIYSFPHEDCEVLPLENITIEALAFHIADALKANFADLDIEHFKISVTESRGQSASYTQVLKESLA